MTPLAAAFLALLAAAAGAALLLSRRDPRHRPVAWYLCAVVAVDVLRWGRSLLLPPATGPREGWELVVRHAEAGLYLASILALPALAWVVFAGRALHSGAKSGASLGGRQGCSRRDHLSRSCSLDRQRDPNPERKSAHTSGAGSVTQSRGCRLARAWVRLRRGVSFCARWPGTGGGLIFSRHRVSSPYRASPPKARRQEVPASDSGHLHDGAISIVSQIRRWFFDSPVQAAWALLTSYLIADYPALSGAELMRIYELVELGAVLFSGLCFTQWLSGPRLLREGLSPAVACTLALISGPAATVAAPYLTRGTTLEAWPGIVAANGVAVAITLVLQIGALTKRRRPCSG